MTAMLGNMKSLLRFVAAAIAAWTLAGCAGQLSDVAKNRLASASSDYDYNLTAQLATDGMIDTEEPYLISVCTKDGELPAREKEWTIDQGPFSGNMLDGGENFLEYRWSRQTFSPAYVRITGTVAYEPAGNHGWEVECFADGALIGRLGGTTLPGKPDAAMTVVDPNKGLINNKAPRRRAGGAGDANDGRQGKANGSDKEVAPTYPTRAFIFEIPVSTDKPFSRFKVSFSMNNAVCWRIAAMDFSDTPFRNGTDGGYYYSKDSRGINLLPSQCFSSAWMSADGSPQWLSVDLGEKLRFNEICLHWIHGPRECKAQVSDDGKLWSDLAIFPQSEERNVKVKVRAKSRYVRIVMEGADESGRFCLSEIEILGKARKKAYSPWRLQRASLVDACGEEISRKGYAVSQWLPAVVPGTVLYSYMAAGAVPDVLISDNNGQVSESFFNSDFWYRGEIEPEGTRGDRRLLVFDGINWKALVYMNGIYVGHIDGAFKQAVFDVTDIAGDKNVIAVKIIRNANFGAVKEKNAESPDFNGGVLGADNPTFHATVGWDWIPTVRGREAGVWNDVRLVCSDDVLIAHPLVRSRIGSDGRADVTASVDLTNLSDKTVSGTLRGGIGGVEFTRDISLCAKEKVSVTFSPESFAQLRSCDLALWWPNGMGNPVLHDAWYVFDSGEDAGERLSYKAGIREFTYSDAGTDLKIFVNGHRFFPKGGNWGFSELNLRFGAEEYDKAVMYHKDMNLNMIRNWVGQTGNDCFYQACDKYGIVVWQDFWLANPADGPDPDDEAMFIDNAVDYLHRIRSHASIGLYCGRNEGYPPATLNEALSLAVKSIHPDILYIPSSADDGVSGHGPYRAVNPDDYFAMPALKFHTERGMPCVMSYASLKKTFSEENIWPVGDVWGQHDFTRTGAQGDETFVRMVREGFGERVMESAESFAHYAQWINYDGYRAMFEANNSGKKGLLIWMSHSCWPSLAWQTYDYWFDRGGAYYGTKKGSENLHIQMNPNRRTVQVCNFRRDVAENLTASVRIDGPDGKTKYSKTATLSIGECEVKDVIDCSGIPDGPCVVTLTLTDAAGSEASRNVYLRNYKDGKNTGDYTALPEETVEAVLSEALK